MYKHRKIDWQRLVKGNQTEEKKNTNGYRTETNKSIGRQGIEKKGGNIQLEHGGCV
jgi:hypothetical protein